MSPRRTGLGRGLDALLGAPEPPVALSKTLHQLRVDQLRPNPLQPRADFSADDLAELASSIETQGLIQPIVVTKGPSGDYTIVAGERRWRAAQQAGLVEVAVSVREIDSEQDLLELALVENLQRADLNVLEEADAYAALRERFGLSQKEIAQRVGRSRTAVTNTLRLLRLPQEVQDLLRAGRLTPGQARPLLRLPGARRQVDLARRAVAEGMSARVLEELSSESDGVDRPRAKRSEVARDQNVHDAAAQERLTQTLQTRVEIRRKARGGTVRVHFHSEEELMRIYEILMRQGGTR